MTDTSSGQTPGQISGREPRLSASHSQTDLRRLSLRGLATMLRMLPPEAVSLEAMAAALRSEAFFVRYEAAVLLARRGDRDARLVMQQALDEGSAPTRATVARHLGGFSWFAAEPLIRQALADPDSRVREAAVYALCDLRELAAYRLLAETLHDAPDNLRAAAAWGLRECEDPAAVPVLAAVMQAADPEVRVRALEALGVNGSPEAVPVARAALHDDDPEVQYAAALTLLELVGEDCLDELADRIHQTTGDARAAILRGLFHATNYLGIAIAETDTADVVIDALAAALTDPDPEARKAAIWPLAWLRSLRASSVLRAAYDRETVSEVRAHILRVAVSLMAEIGEALLQEGLVSPEAPVRAAAAQILRERAGHVVPRFDELDRQRHGLSTPRLEDSEVN